MFSIQILSESKSGNSYFVRVSESIKTPFGNSESQLGVGYVTKQEGAKEFSKGDKVEWLGNVQFQPIVTDGEVSMVNGQYLHRINLVSKELPNIMPVQAKPTETPVSAPKVVDEVPTSDGDPLGDKF